MNSPLVTFGMDTVIQTALIAGNVALMTVNPAFGAPFGLIHTITQVTLVLLLHPNTARDQDAVYYIRSAVAIRTTIGLAAATFSFFGIPFTVTTIVIIAIALIAGSAVFFSPSQVDWDDILRINNPHNHAGQILARHIRQNLDCKECPHKRVYLMTALHHFSFGLNLDPDSLVIYFTTKQEEKDFFIQNQLIERLVSEADDHPRTVYLHLPNEEITPELKALLTYPREHAK